MGCGSSKSSGLNYVDDSVHVMLNHDKKVQQRKGEPVHGYKARAEHPLLKPKAAAIHGTETSDNADNNTGDANAAATAATADTTAANGNANRGAVIATES